MSRAAYMREWRQRSPDVARRLNDKAKARAAAALAVAKLHPEEFERAVAREERKRGLR